MISIALSVSRKFVAGLLLLLVSAWPAVAEEVKPPQGDASRIERLKQALEAETGTPQTELAPMLLPKEQLAPDTLNSMQSALQAYYDYRTQGFEHRRAVFAWQLLSAKIIFAVVVLLVAIGIYFSWIQFTAGMKRKPGPPSTGTTEASTTPGQGEGAAPPPATTTLEASASGIKVSSPVLGVILLVISLLFFYLYLVYIYPIEEIF